MCAERALAFLLLLLVGGAVAAQDFPSETPPAAASQAKPAPAAVPAPRSPRVRSEAVAPAPPTVPAEAAPPVPAEAALTPAPPGVATDGVDSIDAPLAAADDGALGEAGSPAADPAGEVDPEAGPQPPQALVVLDTEVPVGTRATLRWRVSESFDGSAVSTPVTVLHGAKPGPRLCLTAAVHGDELNGVEVVRRVVNDTVLAELSGTVIAVPVVNLLGFSRGSRYLPDRRDLNRFFPGSSSGSAASRIAASMFRDIVTHCTALVDFHTGSFDRSNLPQVRGDLRNPSVLEFTRGFGATPVLHSPGTRGMLRLAATYRGIPAVTFEVGAPLRLEPEKIDFAVQAIKALMHHLGMTRSFRMFAEPQAIFYDSEWIRVDHGGMLFATVGLGDRVRVGQRLGKVIDPLANEEHEVLSPFRGRVIGLALNQVVLPGFAAFHIGIQTSEQQAVEEALQPVFGDDAIEQMEGDEMGPAPPERSPDEPDAATPPGEPPAGG
jgi:predicted deacylase